MNDHNSEVDKQKGESPVNTKKAKKNAARKSPMPIPLTDKPELYSVRMAFRGPERLREFIEAQAIAENRSESNYICRVMLRHMASHAPPDTE